MHVICLEGCHGVGKTELIKDLAARGYTVLDELFIDMEVFELHPQTLTMEFLWIASWFRRLLKIQHEDPAKAEDRILFADRSPFSAIYYSKCAPKEAAHLEGVIRGMISELTQHGIFVHTICVTVEPELLWHRIQLRLQREPQRAALNEDKRWWMDKTFGWYQQFHWDHVIENNRDAREDLELASKGLATILAPCMSDIGLVLSE